MNDSIRYFFNQNDWFYMENILIIYLSSNRRILESVFSIVKITYILRTFNSSGLIDSLELITDNSLPYACKTCVRCSINTVRSYV